MALSFDTTIHPTAIVDKNAQLGTGVQIGPRAVVGAGVRLGDRVQVGVGAIVEGETELGEDTVIYPYATVGSDPQDLKYAGETTRLVVGRRNKIREYVNISRGTIGGGGTTTIGDDNLFMVYVHIGHDSLVGNGCIFANSVAIAGHVEIADFAVFGGLSAAHQFTKIGKFAMIAAGSKVTQDVPPFCMVHGDRAKPNGLNIIGLRRAGISSLDSIKIMYKRVFSDSLTVDAAIEAIETEVPSEWYRSEFVDFLKSSKRGLCR